jgi:hypothetical protein
MSSEADLGTMVMTILEAHVSPEQWDTLKTTFAQNSSRLPSQMVEMFLVQGTADATLWQGISVWRSRQALDEYRRSVETPGGVLMFRSVGAEPTLAIFDVLVAAHHAT